ncbi:PKD domain-containing protein [uncultured Aquimarina sp.]|uniref:PKD domain-containing protein n=1 Tax=uncultured Aquimarina sp. TaxID=575652 RepID=UPI00260D4E22|nr:PKD domain-containing protein [uncultured Aquimarina sp.]
MKPLQISTNYLQKSLAIKPYFILTFALFIFYNGIAQNQKPYELGSEENFSQSIMTNKSNVVTLKLSDTEHVKGIINIRKGNTENYSVIGIINNNSSSTFSIIKDKGIVTGKIILFGKKKAYRYYSGDSDDVLIQEEDINKVLCIDFKKVSSKEEKTGRASAIAPDLQSLPGSEFTVYLDFDGETVSGTSWVGGGTINAQPSGYNDEKITNIWRIMAEDFRPFDINITTNRSIYEATPINKRMMAIFTSTDSAAPGSGGVAYLNSFSSTRNDDPCWVFNSGTRSAGETGSHEVGHTLGLSHDGTTSGTVYYSGHGDWSPIMGWSASEPIGHWSKGEYDGANQDQDDMAIISGDRNGFGYKQDDHGDILTASSELIVDASGDVNASLNTGLISTREDKDVFSFVTSGGAVEFSFEPDPYYPNLNIEAKILTGTGEEVAISSPSRDLSASISSTLAGGTYFIEIDGVGEGNLSTGYSDYSSVGLYSISGSYPPGNNNQPPIANFEATEDCNQVTFRSTSINTVTSYLWDFGDGNTATSQNPTHTYTDNGSYTVSLTVTNDIGNDTNTKDNFLDIEIASVPDTTNEVVCPGESVSITLSGSNGYIWYDQENGTNVIATGSTFETPELTENQIYYVSGTTRPITSADVGIQEISASSGNIHQGGYSLVFDVKEPIILKKAKVSAEGSGNRTLQLKNASGEILESKDINIPDGENIIDININIPAGDNMEIGFTENSNLFRNNQDVNYPYEIVDIVSIKRSTAESNPEGFYYYLYDWQITTLGACETSERTAISVTISDTPDQPVISFDPETSQITVNQEYDAYQWYLNNEAITNATDQSFIAEETGSYTLEVFNAANCSTFSESIAVSTLSVSDTPLSINTISVYPNPTNKILYINGIDESMDIYSIKIVNMLGQVIKKYDNLVTALDTTSLEEGLYFLVINNQMSKKFLKTSS